MDPTPAPVLGNPSGGDSLPSEPDEVVVIPVTPSGPIWVENLIVKITGNNSNNGKKLKAAIYNDDGVGGKPLSRVAMGEEVTITAPDLDGEVTLSFELPPYLTAGTWYIGVHSDGSVEFYGAYGASLVSADVYSDGTGAFNEDTSKDKKLRVMADYRRATRAPISADRSDLTADSVAWQADGY
jgi:hypothetical protein